MSNEDGEHRSSSQTVEIAPTRRARWTDLARGVLIVGAAGALVVAGMGPASSALIPSATLGRRLADTITTSTPPTDGATVVSFARTPALKRQVMTPDFASENVAGPDEGCVPCVRRHSTSLPDRSRDAPDRSRRATDHPAPAGRVLQPESPPGGNTSSVPTDSTTPSTPQRPTKAKPPAHTTPDNSAAAGKDSSALVATADEAPAADSGDHGSKPDRKADTKPGPKSGAKNEA